MKIIQTKNAIVSLDNVCRVDKCGVESRRATINNEKVTVYSRSLKVLYHSGKFTYIQLDEYADRGSLEEATTEAMYSIADILSK